MMATKRRTPARKTTPARSGNRSVSLHYHSGGLVKALIGAAFKIGKSASVAFGKQATRTPRAARSGAQTAVGTRGITLGGPGPKPGGRASLDRFKASRPDLFDGSPVKASGGVADGCAPGDGGTVPGASTEPWESSLAPGHPSRYDDGGPGTAPCIYPDLDDDEEDR